MIDRDQAARKLAESIGKRLYGDVAWLQDKEIADISDLIAEAFREREEVELAKLKDPVAVWINILNGKIARPSALEHYEMLKAKVEAFEAAQPCAEVEASEEFCLKLYDEMADIATECIAARIDGWYQTPEETREAIVIPRVRALLSRAPREASDEIKRLKNLLESHGPEGRNVTNGQYVELRQKLKAAEAGREEMQRTLQWIVDQGVKFDHRGSHSEEVVRRAREALLRAKKPEARTCDGAEAIRRERERQKSVEGWTPEHDDQHANGELAKVAACYALPPMPGHWITDGRVHHWPDTWSGSWWKPDPNRKREIEKAGALLAAEWDRLDRLEPAASDEEGE